MGHTAEQGENVKLVKNANIFTLLIIGHSAGMTKILWLTKVKHIFLARYTYMLSTAMAISGWQ